MPSRPSHLFGSITVPPALEQLVAVFRLQVGQGSETATDLDGWRAMLAHLLDQPLEFISTAIVHVEHFAGRVPESIDDLVGAPWPEPIALGFAMRSLVDPGGADDESPSDLPRWLRTVADRRVVRASVRDESPHDGPRPWIVELDLGRSATSSVNVWVERDGSAYQVYPSDEPLGDVESFLSDLNHLEPNRPFESVPVWLALDAIAGAAAHPESDPRDRLMLEWVLRSRS